MAAVLIHCVGDQSVACTSQYDLSIKRRLIFGAIRAVVRQNGEFSL